MDCYIGIDVAKATLDQNGPLRDRGQRHGAEVAGGNSDGYAACFIHAPLGSARLSTWFSPLRARIRSCGLRADDFEQHRIEAGWLFLKWSVAGVLEPDQLLSWC